MFEGYTDASATIDDVRIHAVKAGRGPALLLLHGHPQTHAIWHKVAPVLARHFTVIAADLRGYGDSGKPAGGDRHVNYSFRAMAQDQVEVMAALGFDRFFAAGHDRGARVLHRMCLDWPEKVGRAALLDILPQHFLLNHVNRDFGIFSWHWFFMVQPFDFPERLMLADPEFFLRKKLAKTAQGLNFFDADALAEWIRCMRDPATVHAMCEDYRATFTVDLEMDTADFEAGRRIECPTLILWGATGGVGRNQYSPTEVWPLYARDIRRMTTVPSGHYLSEEAPTETAAELDAFFGAA